MLTATLVAFSIALVASLLLTVPVRALALRTGMVDLPGPRKVHQQPTPLLGGLAMYIAVLLAILFVSRGSDRAQSIGVLAGATLVAAVGFLDDRGWLHHQIKLFVGMPAAAIILLTSGIHVTLFRNFVSYPLGVWLDATLTIVWVVGITASFSILDHMDGLCAGIAGMASLFFALIAYLNNQSWAAVFAAAVLGAVAGFLRWNFNPAKIFMGDGGAMFLGFLMATLGLTLRLENASFLTDALVPVFALGVPIFDTTLIIISRSRRGLLPFASPGKDHTAHRLANLGFGQRGTVLSLYAAGALNGIAAVLVSHLSPRSALLAAPIAIVVALAGIAFLESSPYERQAARFNSPQT